MCLCCSTVLLFILCTMLSSLPSVYKIQGKNQEVVRNNLDSFFLATHSLAVTIANIEVAELGITAWE